MSDRQSSSGVSRRALLVGGAAAVGGGTAALAAACSPPPPAAPAAPAGTETVPFHGEHQAGIETPGQSHAVLLALDLRPG